MSQSTFAAGVGAKAARVGWVLPSVRLTVAVCGLTLGAVAAVEVLFIGTTPLFLLTALLALPSLGIAAIATFAKQRARRLGGDLGMTCTPRVVVAVLGFTVFFVGSALSNVLLVDMPTEPWTLVGYAISLVLAILTSLAAYRASRTSSARELYARRWREILAGVCFAAGVGLTLIDACCFPHAFPSAHLATMALALVGFAASGVVVCSTEMLQPRTRGSLQFVGVLALLVVVCGGTMTARRSGFESLLRTRSSGRTFLVTIRRALDRDGDGYSAWLGGGDCDDNDPHAYPLSTVGRDCVAIVPPDTQSAFTPAPAAAPKNVAPTAPPIVVLVTIDAFRCGFGGGERPELTHACPNLADLSVGGLFQPRAYARAPHTLGSLASILAYEEGGSVEPLPAALRLRGYRTEAITTHAALLHDRRLRASFDVTDESLVPLAHPGSATTSELVTDHVLDRIREALRSGTRTFLWAHYYDTHSPYVQKQGSHFVWSHPKAYVEEVKRTDRAIGRLVSELRHVVPRDEVALFITADHGEELGEHGGTDHGATLYDEVVRVPFVAWRSGPDPRRGLPKELPAGDIDMAPYVMSVVTDAPFSPSQTLFLEAKTPVNDALVGVVHGNLKYIFHHELGYEELFDVDADPHEKHDLSAERATDLNSMRQLLGHLVRREQQSRTAL